MINANSLIEKCNKLKGYELITYKNNTLTGWGKCLYCQKDTIQLTCFDNDTDEKVNLCTVCLNVNEV